MPEATFERDYEDFFAREERLRRLIFQWIPEEGPNLIDLGCKTGNITAQYRNKSKAVIGLDQDYRAVWVAKRNCSGVKFLVGKIEELPLKAGSFHALVISQVLGYIEDPRRALGEISRVLRPGGILILSVPHGGRWGQVLNPGNIRSMWENKRLRPSRPLHGTSYSLTSLKELLEGEFTIERAYRGGTILYPYLAKMLGVLVRLARRGYGYGEERLKNRAVRGMYLRVLCRLYLAASRMVKGLMKIDFSLPLGKYSQNILVQARRDGR